MRRKPGRIIGGAAFSSGRAMDDSGIPERQPWNEESSVIDGIPKTMLVQELIGS